MGIFFCGVSTSSRHLRYYEILENKEIPHNIDAIDRFITRDGVSIMSIKMPNKKFPQISVSQGTYVSLQNVKFELKARSMNETIEALVKEHMNRMEVSA